jgi:hypothetical protein
MKKLVLLLGMLALVVGGGPIVRFAPDVLTVGLFAQAALLGLGALGLAQCWDAPFPTPRAARYAAPPTKSDEGPLLVPVLCYRPNGQVDWVLGELLPGPQA